MGLFDAFKTTKTATSPSILFTVSLIFMIAADGEIEDEEIGHLFSSINQFENPHNLLDKSIEYWKNVSFDKFLTECNNVFDAQQKLSVLLNLCESLLADGVADPSEQVLFGRFLNAFGWSEADFTPYAQVIIAKNDRAIFM